MVKEDCLNLDVVKQLQDAKDMLSVNWTGEYTVPSRAQYPHMWLWDSCFHAMLNARFAPDRAKTEMRSLLQAQWEDGRIPHITFNTEETGKYRPNHEDYATGKNSSGITQPPVVAGALLYIYAQDGDLNFIRECYPAAARYHRWLKETRDADDAGLLAILHPWESGTDNSPIFNESRDRFLATKPKVEAPPRADKKAVNEAERPSDDDYIFYWGLVEIFKSCGWDAKQMAEKSPMRIADPLFNSIWAQANEDLAALAALLGEKDDAALFAKWNAQTQEALREKLWCEKEGFFFALDLTTNKKIRIRTSSGFLPLYAGVPDAAMRERLLAHLRSRREFWTPFGLPGAAMDEDCFDPCRYWQGPVWINVNWLVQQGLLRAGEYGLAHKLALASEKLVERAGFREYYHPWIGEGLGAPNFSWSALAAEPLIAPDEVFRTPTQVFPLADIAKGSEAAAVYTHPETKEIKPEDLRTVSAGENLLRGALSELDDALAERDYYKSKKKAAPLFRLLAAEVEIVLGKARPGWLDHLRSCDLSALLLHDALKKAGVEKISLRAAPLHYFVTATDEDGAEWALDASGDQFAFHPLSRVAVLFEQAALFLAEESHDGIRRARALSRTLLAAERILRRYDFIHCDAADIEALTAVLKRLQSRLGKTENEKRYGAWLTGTACTRFGIALDGKKAAERAA